MDSNAHVLCAGNDSVNSDTSFDLKSKALTVALKTVREMGRRCSSIYISSKDFWEVLHGLANHFHWMHSNCFKETKQELNLLHNPKIHLIQNSWNKVAATLAEKGIQASRLSLFHQSVERPRWLMKKITQAGLHP